MHPPLCQIFQGFFFFSICNEYMYFVHWSMAQGLWMAGSSRKRKRVLITKAETSVREVILHFVSFVNGAYWLL